MNPSTAPLVLLLVALASGAAAEREAGKPATPPARGAVRPYAYLIPDRCRAAVEGLQRRGVPVHEFREDVELEVEVYRICKLPRAKGGGGKNRSAEAAAEMRRVTQRFSAGTWLVRADQLPAGPVGDLLEPPPGSSAPGLWDEYLAEGRDFPVARLGLRVPLLTFRKPPPREKPPAKKPLDYAAVFGSRPVDLSGNPAWGFHWLPCGQHFVQFKDGELCKVHAVTGRSEPLADIPALAAALEKLEGMTAADARRLAEQPRQRTDPQFTAALLEHGGDLYYATLDGKAARRLTDSREPEELATFSPDGQRVAFVRNNDLFAVDVRTGKERRLTEGGSATLRNGKADWVYFEEIYHRSWRAFRWSPDSQSVAFQQFDDTRVGRFTVVDHLAIGQRLESESYPLAGQPNPQVRLGVVRAAGGDVRWIDTSNYSPDNMLITHFGWTPDSQAVYFYVQDRGQRWLDFNRAGLGGPGPVTLFREQTPAWVHNPGDPQFLKDGSFLLPSERDGWRHLYHFAADGKLIRRVTEGPWEVRQLHAVDESSGWICFSGTRDSHLAENLYRVKLDGSQLTRLTKAAGSHRAVANPAGTLLADSWSDCRTPTRVQLLRADGSCARLLDTNPVPALDEYRLCPVELVHIRARDGFVLEGSLVKPPDFDPRRRYPVWLLTYGGPHAPSLADAWQGGRMFEQLLAGMGILAFRCDPRSASGKGACSAWQAYRQLGVQELRDLEDALDWLGRKPFVDPSRIGISGHSYGGFLTAYALTHSRRFAAGIAGAPVTDWRNYDTIYTERYMGTPQENPGGYEKTSVVANAKNLHGRLLLIHGARDDNVHLANTLQLAHALQQANKTFDMMIYPPYRHGIGGPHYRRLMIDFIRRTMLGD
mgnify:CR=1 FL=1